MDFRNIITKMRELDPTTPGEDLQRLTTLAESTGISMGAEDSPKEVITESAEVVAEKAVSKAQQKLMGQAYALKKGDAKASDASEEVKKLAKDMSMSDLKDFASTKHKGKPEHVKKESVKEAAKPDFADIDGDGDKKEPMKKAAKDKKEGGDKKSGKKEMSDKQKKYFGKKNESVELVDDFGEVFEADMSNTVKKATKAALKKSNVKAENKDAGKALGKGLAKGAKKTVKESVEPKMSFVEMMKMVRESGGQQAIDPMDDALWTWANRVAVSKVEETNKQEIFAAMLYERNGGRFEMYDVVEKGLTEGKDCNCGPDCACKGNCGDDCNCGPDC